MFFTRKKGRNNLIYPSVHRQTNYDSIKYYVKDSALFKSNVKRLNIEENDVNLYLSYIFSKYVKIIETKNEELQLALAKKENGIDADNIEELGEEAEEIFNQDRDKIEREKLIDILTVLNKELLVNTPFMEFFRGIDNQNSNIFEFSKFSKSKKNPFYLTRDKMMDCMMPRDMLPEIVLDDILKQIDEYILEKKRFPREADIQSSLIEKEDLDELLEVIKDNIFLTRRNYEEFYDKGSIQSMMSISDRIKFRDLVDVFIPGEAGIDENETIELIAKNMVWNNRLAKVVTGIHGDIVRNLALRPVDTTKLAEAMDDTYFELMQTEMISKGNHITLLDKFIKDYTDFIEGKVSAEDIEQFYSSQIVLETLQKYCKNKNIINLEECTLDKIYEYLSSRQAESSLYFCKNSNLSLLIDEVSKSQRMGSKKYKLAITKDSNVSNDKVSVELSIRGRNGRYRVHGIGKEINASLNKKQNREMQYLRVSEKLPIDFSTIYPLSNEQKIEILHLLAERTIKSDENVTQSERRNRRNRIRMLNYYANDIMNEIRASGSREEKNKINNIAHKKSYRKILIEEAEKNQFGEPRSYKLRSEMLKILYSRQKEERGLEEHE